MSTTPSVAVALVDLQATPGRDFSPDSVAVRVSSLHRRAGNAHGSLGARTVAEQGAAGLGMLGGDLAARRAKWRARRASIAADMFSIRAVFVSHGISTSAFSGAWDILHPLW